ncbi:MAG: biopolymer transporter ExbD [Phycisphaerae bacterium]
MLIRDAEFEQSIHIDFVPMADVLFNLLIFFLLATTIAQVEREINVALPFASSAAPISQALREMIVNVDEQGRILLSGTAIEPDELHRQLEEAVKVNREQKVSVRGDRRTAYANVVRVLDICKAAGVQEPYLDTVME